VQFRLVPNDERPLRPISFIPDEPTCLIEGRNGAGKSLAVRLLQLATGEQPYASTPAAWRSLREGLGELQIIASGMVGAASIEWTLRPSGWPEDPAPVGAWLGDFQIDGQPADLGRVRNLLRVHRVGGDESLSETIAQRVREDLGIVQRQRRWVDERAERLDQRLLDLSDRLAGTRLEELEALSDELRADRQRLRELRETVPLHQARFRALDAARRGRDTIAQLESDGPELRRQIDAESEIEREATATIEDLERRRVELAGQAAKEADLRGSLDAAEAELSKSIESAEEAQLRAMTRASKLRVRPESEAVREAHQAAVAERDAVLKRLGQFDVAPRLASLADALEERLQSAVSAGLSDSPIAQLDDDREITVAELEKGVTRHRKRQQEPADALIAELRAEASNAEARVSDLWSLRQSVAYADRKAREARDQAARLEGIRQQLEPDVAKHYNELSAEIASARDRHLQAVVRRADLIAQLDRLSGGRQIADVRRELEADLTEANVDAERLDLAWAQAKLDYETSQAELESITSAERDLAATVETRLGEVRNVASGLATEENAWLAAAAGHLLPEIPAADLSTARQLGRLRAVIDRARDVLQAAVTKLTALEQPLESMSRAIEKNDVGRLRSSAPELQALYDRLLALYEAEFTSRFRAREIADALFDGAESVSLDLKSLSVSWTMSDGAGRNRPLEAFSSGERAFAYTLARLESLASEPTHNRVIALDEFGAFVARDRLDRLVRFLHNRILGTVAQQVLIILPLTQDYAGQIASTTGEWHEVVARRAAAVAEQGYFAERFEVSA
jgi:DNA repair exonuclease SbcCD ATPase subunit